MSSGRGSSKSEDRNTIRMREIQSGVSENKRCFECHQRGPNYVNVSIGAFVCTKCSGMLRGVTPPHRIKSISMSTFSNEDVSFLDSRGNLWCQKVWLATYTSGSLSEESKNLGDEVLKQHIHEKYEKKRYYLDPSSISNLETYSSSHLRQNSKGSSSGGNPHSHSPSSALIGSRISQKLSSSTSSSGPKVRNGGHSNLPLLNGGSLSAGISQANGSPRPISTNTLTNTTTTTDSSLQSIMDPFGSSFGGPSPSGGAMGVLNSSNVAPNTSTAASNGFEAFANFDTANFDVPPTGSSPKDTTCCFPSPDNAFKQQMQQVNTNNPLAVQQFDTNNNNNNPRFDFHFNTRPILSNDNNNNSYTNTLNNNAFVDTNTNAPISPIHSGLPLLTHDSNAVERRKKSKLHLDSPRPWVDFTSQSIGSPPLPPDRKKYIPISKSKSSSSAFGSSKSPPDCNIIDSPKNNNPFFSTDVNNNIVVTPSNNPFLTDTLRDNNNNNFFFNDDSIHPVSSCCSTRSVDAFNVGLTFFQSLITPSPLVDVLDDCSVVTNITDSLRSFQRSSNSSCAANHNHQNKISSPSLTTSPEPSGNQHMGGLHPGAPPPSRTSAVVSPTMNSNTSMTSEDRYAALKDLDDIFRSVQVTPSENNGGGDVSNLLSSGSANKPLNGVNSIFGGGSEGSDKMTASSLFDTSPSSGNGGNRNSNETSWKRLSSNSSDNAGWANFGSMTTSSSSTSTAGNSNPFNALGGGTSTSNTFSQLNTSPWPTTGTSPVQSAFPNGSSSLGSNGTNGNNSRSTLGGSGNGFSDPFSVSNQSFQNSSEILSNDLFANAPKPNSTGGGIDICSKVSNLSHPTMGENLFSSSTTTVMDNTSSAPNPWDSPFTSSGPPIAAFTDNMQPSFNPKNPFL